MFDMFEKFELYSQKYTLCAKSGYSEHFGGHGLSLTGYTVYMAYVFPTETLRSGDNKLLSSQLSPL